MLDVTNTPPTAATERAPHRGDDLRQELSVVVSAEGGVEVNQMQPIRAGRCGLRGEGSGILAAVLCKRHRNFGKDSAAPMSSSASLSKCAGAFAPCAPLPPANPVKESSIAFLTE